MKPIVLNDKGLNTEWLKHEGIMQEGTCTLYSLIVSAALLYPNVSTDHITEILKIMNDPETYKAEAIENRRAENNLPYLFDFNKNRSYFDNWILHSQEMRDFTYGLVGELFDSYGMPLLFRYTDTNGLQEFINKPNEDTTIVISLNTNIDSKISGHNATLFYNEDKFYIIDINFPDPFEILTEDINKLISGDSIEIDGINVSMDNGPHHFIQKK